MNEYGEELVKANIIGLAGRPATGIQAIYQRLDGPGRVLSQVVHWRTHSLQDGHSYGPGHSPLESMDSVARLLLSELLGKHG